MKASSYNWMASRLLVCIVLTVTPLIAVAEAKINVQRQYTFNLPRQSVAESLNDLAKQTGEQFLFPYQLAESKAAKPVTGHFTLFEATQILLRDTGLTSDLVDGVLIISLADDIGASSYQNHKGKSMNSNKRKNLLATMIGLFAVSGVAQQVYGQDGATGQSRIDEIIVTAQKGAGKSIQDTAMAISALDGDTITKRGLVGMDDYLRTLPGVSMQDRGAAGNSIVIRGIGADMQNEDSTAGVYFGEVPVSDVGSSNQTGRAGSADIKMVDIERVEVLRGPQGTLYGSGSMAGTVRVVPVAPDLEKIEGKFATRYSQTGESGDDNTMVQGVINIPLVQDKLGIRAVAYKFDNSGYIDNVAASQPTPRITAAVNDADKGGIAQDRGDVGSDEYTGFRLTTLWKPSDALDLTLTYLQQEIDQNGQPEVNLNATTGDYQQVRLNTGIEGSSHEQLEAQTDIASLVVNYDLGWATLTSASSWIQHDVESEQDATFRFLQSRPFFYDNENTVEVFAEELRLASQLDGPLQFVTGLYYEDRKKDLFSFRVWSGDAAQAPAASALPASNFFGPTTIEQLAWFGESTYKVSEQLSVTLGMRYFDYDKKESFTNISNGVVRYRDRQGLIKETGQTYKAAMNYTPNEDVLLYGSWSEGFRLGSGGSFLSNSCDSVGFTVPPVDSDRSKNLEFGVKTSLVDNRITLNAALFRIDWDDLPVNIVDPCPHTANAGKAQSEGIELEFQGALADNIRLDVSASYVDATLEEDSSLGNKGDNLPGSADWNMSVGLEYGFTLANYSSFARIDYAYVGDYYNNFAETGTAAGGFSQMHIKAGIDFDQFAVSVFVNNVTNENALTWVETVRSGFSLDDAVSAFRIRPRTIGFNVGYHF